MVLVLVEMPQKMNIMKVEIKSFIVAVLIILGVVSVRAQDSLKCATDSINIVEKVDLDAEFIGGEVELFNYLNNIDFSKQEFEKSKIKICLIIDSMGGVTPYKINGKLTNKNNLTAFEKRYIRALELMPKWNPAICNKQKVNSYYYITHNIDVK